jgi:dihydroneopterin aldolase
MDTIVIQGLDLFAYHGVLPQEREQGQVFFLDLRIEADLSCAAYSDDLAETLDYTKLIDVAARAFTEQPCNLIEFAVNRVGQVLLRVFPQIETITVRVHKPNAPISRKVSDISLETQFRRCEPE